MHPCVGLVITDFKILSTFHPQTYPQHILNKFKVKITVTHLWINRYFSVDNTVDKLWITFEGA